MTQALDPDPHSISKRVIREIAAHKGVDETEIEPLYVSLDPEALDRLVSPPHRDPPAVAVSFEHANHHVFIDQTGNVTVQEQ